MRIKFNNVTHYYQKPKRKKVIEPAIKNIDLTFEEPGEFVMIVGETGAGKTTLLSHINGLLLPYEGTVEVDNFTLTPKKNKNPKLKNIRKRIGYVFQFPEYQLFEDTVLKDIIYGPINFGMTDLEATERAKKVASDLGISDLLDKSPFEISGGQMRKSAIAGIIAYNPDVFLLDEPTRGLDPRGTVEMMKYFNSLREEGKTLIMITHDMDMVYRYATRVIVLQDSEIKFDGKKEDLFQGPFLEYGLSKPKILTIIDEINDEAGFDLPYTIYNEEDLLKALKENCHE